MKAVVFKGKGKVEVIEKEKPSISSKEDAIVRVTKTTICGTDLHILHGKSAMEKNHTIGHEAIGIVETIGEDVKTVKPGDKVLITASIGCGVCEYCRRQEYSQCLNANKNVARRGTAFFGGPVDSGGYDGVQAEYVKAPYADTTLYKIPEGVSDEQALLLTDVLPTGYYATEVAKLQEGESVVIYGAGPVGQMAAISARLKGASKIYVVDCVPERLNKAKEHAGAETLNFKEVDPVLEIKTRTNNLGVDKAIDAVGLEAEGNWLEKIEGALMLETSSSRSINWAIDSTKRLGIVVLSGLYAGKVNHFLIDPVFYNNISVSGANTPHRRYIDTLVGYIREGRLKPEFVFTKEYNFDRIEEAYNCFNTETGKCIKALVKVTDE